MICRSASRPCRYDLLARAYVVNFGFMQMWLANRSNDKRLRATRHSLFSAIAIAGQPPAIAPRQERRLSLLDESPDRIVGRLKVRILGEGMASQCEEHGNV